VDENFVLEQGKTYDRQTLWVWRFEMKIDWRQIVEVANKK
jgi:hypothetical protein